MENELGWRSQIGFASGLQRMIDWLVGNPKWLEYYSLPNRLR